MTSARWLVDKSVLARLRQPTVANTAWDRIRQGTVGVSIVTELEMGLSARSGLDYRQTRQQLVEQLIPVSMPLRTEIRAREVQAALVERGQHRSAGVADLLIAPTAEVEGLTVLHYDADFDLIAEVTGQPCEWVGPGGTV